MSDVRDLRQGDIVLYQDNEFSVGFIYPKDPWSYTTRQEGFGRIRLQNPTDSTRGHVKVNSSEVTFVRRPSLAPSE